MSQWTQEQAIALCRKIEAVCPPFGCHVALTGGALYKDGPRKEGNAEIGAGLLARDPVEEQEGVAPVSATAGSHR